MEDCGLRLERLVRRRNQSERLEAVNRLCGLPVWDSQSSSPANLQSRMETTAALEVAISRPDPFPAQPALDVPNRIPAALRQSRINLQL